MSSPGRLAVTFVFSRACPSHEEGLALLHRAAGAVAVDLDLEVVEVLSDAHAERIAFPGSPTYLAGGRDLFPREEPDHAPAMDACRAYRRPGGGIGPLPHPDDLAAALRGAAKAAAA